MAIVTIRITDKFQDGEIDLKIESTPLPREGHGLTVAQLLGNTVAGMIRSGEIAKHIPGLEGEKDVISSE